MKSTLIRPGLLVSLKTTIRGGVAYQKRTLESDHAEGAARVAAWNTTRRIEDAEDHEQAIVARGKARSLITAVCCPSDFGLLCPMEKQFALAQAIADARDVASAYNVAAKRSRVDVYVITGQVAASDEEAIRSIGAEVTGLLDSMQAGVRAMDATAVRDAANKARALAGMLTDDTAGKVNAAIAEVRRVARQIVKDAKAGADAVALDIDTVKFEALNAARFAVLDLTAETVADAMPVAGRAIEFEVANDPYLSALPGYAPRAEIELAASPAIELE